MNLQRERERKITSSLGIIATERILMIRIFKYISIFWHKNQSFVQNKLLQTKNKKYSNSSCYIYYETLLC